MLAALSELEASLRKQMQMNKARISCLANMLLGLFSAGSVNLKAIAVAGSGTAQMNSRYRRLQRFFAAFKIDMIQIARWIFRLCFEPSEKLYLAMDRTNWKWGKAHINIFMLAVVYKGLAIPLFWTLLPKGGSSNHEEQQGLIQRFLDTFGLDCIAGVLADREFANGYLFQWLAVRHIPFVIRIKGNTFTRVQGKRDWAAKQLFTSINPNESMTLPATVALFDQGVSVHLSGSRSERGELLIVATNQPNPQDALSMYRRRWQIESLFQGLKGRGFRFEETHITCPERMTKLTALLAIGFVWAHKVGEWQALNKPIPIKLFQDGSSTPQYSFFRYGLDFLREALRPFHGMVQQFRQCVRVLVDAFGQPVYAS